MAQSMRMSISSRVSMAAISLSAALLKPPRREHIFGSALAQSARLSRSRPLAVP